VREMKRVEACAAQRSPMSARHCVLKSREETPVLPFLKSVPASRLLPQDFANSYQLVHKFWTNSELRTLLCQEGEATTAYVKYGFLIGAPDWGVHEFSPNERDGPSNRCANFSVGA
jgi:hypothetical protein